MSSRRLIILLVTFVPLIVFVIAAIAFLIAQVQIALGRIDVVLVDELERQLGRDVELGRVQVRPLGTLVIEDLRIAGDPQIEGENLLTAQRVVVNYRLADLMLGRVSPIQSISSVRVIQPVALFDRSPQGVWNFGDLLRPRPPAPPFTGVVVIENGTITVRDHRAHLPQIPAVNRITNVNAVVDAAEAPSYMFEMTAQGTLGRAGDIRVLGSGNTERNLWEFDIAAADADAAHWTGYFVQPGAARVVGGRLDLSLTITYAGTEPPGRRTALDGAAQVREGLVVLTSVREPVRDLAGVIAFTQTIATLDLRGRAAGSPFTVSGTVADFADPQLDLNIASDRMDYGALRNLAELPPRLRDIQLSGTGPLTVSVVGDASRPLVSANVSIPAASGFGYQARNLRGTIVHREGVLQFPRMAADMLGGHVVLSGSVALAPTVRFDLTGQATGVSLAALPLPPEADVRGRASGTFSVTGTSEQPRVAIDVQVGPGILNTVSFSSASGRFVWTDQRIRIDDLTMATAGGVVRAAGLIVGSQLRLDVSAAGVDLARLMQQLGLEGLAGRAYLRGVVTGTIQDPIFTGRAEIFNGRFGQYAFDYARGRLIATSDQIALEDTTLRVFPAEMVIAGRIVGIATRRPEVDLVVQVAEAPASQVLRFLRLTADVTGRVSGTLRIVGTLPEVTVAGDLALRDGRVLGFPVSTAATAIEYRAGIVTVRNFIAQTDGTTLAATGTVDSTGQADLRFSIADLSLALLNQYTSPYVHLAGTVELVTGRLVGDIRNPTVSASLLSEDIVINNERFSRLELVGSWMEGRAALEQLVLARDEQLLRIDDLVINQPADRLVLAGSMDCLRISTILRVFQGSPYVRDLLRQPVEGEAGRSLRAFLANLPSPTEGAVSLAFSASGALSAPDATLRGVIAELTLGQARVDFVNLAVRAEEGSVVVEDLSAAVGEAVVRVQPGVVYTDGQLDLDIAATNIDAAIVGAFIGRQDLRGTASIDASIQGSIASPLVVASLEIAQPEIAGLAFDRLRASRIEMGADSITLSDIILVSDGYRAVVFGTIPWSWEELTVPTDRPIDLRAELREQDLALLGMISRSVLADETRGRLDAVLDIRGTIEDPDLIGYLEITEGRIAFLNVATPLENIEARVDFDQDRLVVQHLTGSSAAGGTFAVLPGGQISLRDQNGRPINLAFQTRGLALRARNLLGYGETVALTVDSDLDVTGTLPTPVITGDINLHSGTIAVAPPPFVPPILREVTFNPQFNVRVSVGRDVEFLNPRIRANILGVATVVGTLAEPVVQGELQLPRGEIRLPTARFRLQPGSSVVIDYAPPERARLLPNIVGRTSVTATSPLGTRRRYEIIMEVGGSLPPAENLRVQLRSDPPDLGQARILAILGHAEDLFGNGEGGLRQELLEIFTAVTVPSLFQPIEAVFLEAFGLTEFEIEYSLGQPFAILASREIARNFYLTYWRSIAAADVDYWLKLSYEVFGRFRIGYVTGPRTGGAVQTDAIWRF